MRLNTLPLGCPYKVSPTLPYITLPYPTQPYLTLPYAAAVREKLFLLDVSPLALGSWQDRASVGKIRRRLAK